MLQLNDELLSANTFPHLVKAGLQALKTFANDERLGQTLQLPTSETLCDEVLPNWRRVLPRPKHVGRLHVVRQVFRNLLRSCHSASTQRLQDRQGDLVGLFVRDCRVYTSECVGPNSFDDIFDELAVLVVEEVAGTALSTRTEVLWTCSCDNTYTSRHGELGSHRPNGRRAAVHHYNFSCWRCTDAGIGELQVSLLTQPTSSRTDRHAQDRSIFECDIRWDQSGELGWNFRVQLECTGVRLITLQTKRKGYDSISFLEAGDILADLVDFACDVRAENFGPSVDKQAIVGLEVVDGIDGDRMIPCIPFVSSRSP